MCLIPSVGPESPLSDCLSGHNDTVTLFLSILVEVRPQEAEYGERGVLELSGVSICLW